MISFNELGRGVQLVLDGDPYEIVETTHMVKGRGGSVLQTKLKNLKTGNLLSKTFRPSESFQEAEISKISIKFLYKNKKGEHLFCKKDDPSKRFSFSEALIGSGAKFLKEGELVGGVVFRDEVINITLPIKVTLRVTEAPPGVKGDRAQSGNKVVKLETGAEIAAPLFIKEGDLLEINSETEEYVRRV